MKLCRSHLKIRILVQGQGGNEFQPAGILMYVEELKRVPNAGIEPKDFFEIASNNSHTKILTSLSRTRYLMKNEQGI